MGLKPVLMRVGNPIQRAVLKRKLQLRAVLRWVQDLKDGQENIPLKNYCEAVGAPYKGITRILREEKVQELIGKAVEHTALLGMKLSTSLLVKRLEEEGLRMGTRDVIAAGEHLSKIKNKVYSKQESGGNKVLVNINLPEGSDYSEPIRVEAREKASEELGDLLDE